MQRARTVDLRLVADGVGLLGSALCALHCLAAPVLLVAGTALPATFAGDESFHQLLLWALLPAGSLAFGLGCFKHKDLRVLALGVLGLAGISAAAWLGHDGLGEVGERSATLASAGLLIAAHVLNFRQCRAADCEHEEWV